MYGMKKLWLIVYFVPVMFVRAQSIHKGSVVSGPMLGQVELRTASIWIQVSSDVSSAALVYWKKGHPETSRKTVYSGILGKEFNPLRFDIGGLDINSIYEYQFILNQQKSSALGSFHTKDLWQWRHPAPDFSFITGSCAYFNDPAYDRPGKPYGGDSII